MRLFILLVAANLAGQVLLIDGESAFVVPPRTSVELKVVLSGASLGGNVAGVNVRFVPPAGQPSVTVRTDASGKASTTYTTPETAGYFNVDAVAELGDGAVASFAFSVGTPTPTGSATALKAEGEAAYYSREQVQQAERSRGHLLSIVFDHDGHLSDLHLLRMVWRDTSKCAAASSKLENVCSPS